MPCQFVSHIIAMTGAIQTHDIAAFETPKVSAISVKQSLEEMSALLLFFFSHGRFMHSRIGKAWRKKC